MTSPDPLARRLADDRRRLEGAASRSPADRVARRIRRRGWARTAVIAAAAIAGGLLAWQGLNGLARAGLLAEVPGMALIAGGVFMAAVAAAVAWTLDWDGRG